MLKLRRRIAFWIAVVVGLPVVAKTLHAAGNALEHANGPGQASKRLHQVGRGAERLHRRLRRSR